ncbi:oxidoreductase [Actinomyces sp. Z5]|uniref:FAD-dependent oxidoreductase n=1 Tax=Actinomyces sp. Z5 TaxID=2250216 RepID=UPI000DCEE56D|nr:FAD-binding protein [Actinomyces sp. Z5]RAX20068.1 oxidoreductase [Actinomyces sp. Z5]
MPVQSSIRIDGVDVPVLSANTVVVGTGAAGYCAADRLVQYGQEDVLIISDRIATGSSRNAGSDKQTYYKLTLGGGAGDSVAEMAQTLFDGGAMDGDTALVEAALSSQAFLHLVDLGVDFPRNRFGEFVGYKTDHDPRQRATSVGPYTSRTMVERLEAKVRRDGTRVVENLRVVEVLVADGEAVGLVCLRRRVTQAEAAAGTSRFLLVRARSIVYATGGPAGMYARSVFPHGQWGAAGAAFRAGAAGRNLTEWQYGLASIAPRWNVSGSYMQVLPTFISTDLDGGDAREFLPEAIPDYGRLLSLTFLKGYQWPFDIRKARGGSSLIDLLVYRETAERGRRVFLDFTRNPGGLRLDPDALDPEAREYLGSAGALFGTPVQRLIAMNRPAYELYREKNPVIDLARDRLEIDVCVQHNNGGLAVDCWWQSTALDGFFPVGEAAGAHGVYRPGGAALNSTQVGATRSAQWIAARRRGEPLDMTAFAAISAPAVEHARGLLADAGARVAAGAPDNTGELLTRAQVLMSEHAGLVRSAQGVSGALGQVREMLVGLSDRTVVDTASRRSVERLFLLRDILTSQFVYLSAMADYLRRGGRSRGSVLYTDAAGLLPEEGLPDSMRFMPDDGALDAQVQEVALRCGADGVPAVETNWRPRRPLPDTGGDFFENVWRDFREDGGVR